MHTPTPLSWFMGGGVFLPTTILIYYLRHLFSDMKAGFKDLLFYPDTFFENIAQEKVNLIPPTIIVAGGGAISLSRIFIYAPYLGNPLNLTSISLIIACYVLWPLLGWVLVSGAFYLISRLFSKAGSFFATFQNVGYGLLPWVISNFVSVVATSILYTRSYYYFQHASPDTFASYATSIVSTRSYYYTSPWLWPSTVSAIIFLVFMLWCCCIWVYAMKNTCQIPLQRAIIVVIITVMVLFLAVYLPAIIPSVF
jgi:hypothetical protein